VCTENKFLQAVIVLRLIHYSRVEHEHPRYLNIRKLYEVCINYAQLAYINIDHDR